jgi:hypothetical protein
LKFPGDRVGRDDISLRRAYIVATSAGGKRRVRMDERMTALTSAKYNGQTPKRHFNQRALIGGH